MHKIEINDLILFGYHGVYEIERTNGQYFNLNISYSLKKANLNDDISNTIDYCDVMSYVELLFKEKSYNLLEELSEHIAIMLVKKYKMANIEILIKKSNKFISKDLKNITVKYKIDNE